MKKFTWGASHKARATISLNEMKAELAIQSLNDLPGTILAWIKVARPNLLGKPRNFLLGPFWEEIYKCDASKKFIIGGRQIFKSTYFADLILFELTSKKNSQVCYISFSDGNKNTFAKQKIKNEAIMGNAILSAFIKKGAGNNNSLSLTNGSTVYYITDHNEFKNIEGKSLDHILIDEAQYADFDTIEKIYYTLTQTKGKITIAGIGGEMGSSYEKEWNKTDQREWIYDDIDWRNKLQFNSKGLIVDKYLEKVLQGKWVAQKPENSEYPGFHLPQILFANIPLLIDDAKNKYKIPSELSIEYKKNNETELTFKNHTMGEFSKSFTNPITPQMVLDCIKPYDYLHLMNPFEIAEIKLTFGNEVKISMGVDFGSGKKSHTVISILIYWKKSERIQLVYYEKCLPENQLEQAQRINKLFRNSMCDVGIGDLGYGVNQIKIIQKGLNQLGNTIFEGVGDNTFFGCRTGVDNTRYLKIDPAVTDEHGEKSSLVTISKSASILNLIGTLEKRVMHPISKKQHTVFLFPSTPSNLYDPKKFILALCSVSKEKQHQQSSIEFKHPDDTVMSLIYAMVGLEVESEWHWISA
ncbi:MAG: terminase family protein [Nitrosarchaeum sp.]|nr:terminase family protein [Nitrosarchaeum sp.]MDW7641631.1 terminase family protein [Nitrosarchaeum sp.]